MKRYPKYKDSGVPWLGQVPEHWEVKRCKHYLRERNLRSVDGAETLLSVSEYFGVKPRAEAIDDGDVLVRAKTLVDYKVCRVGDLVMNIMLACKRAYGVTRHEGIVSPAYAVFRFTSDQLLPEYLHYLLRTDMYADEFKRNSTGVIDSRLRLYPEEFFRTPFLVPPVKEQEDVIRFLDEAVRQMDSAISSQERMIELLKERRSAIITQAVTKGLDPKAKMKDSGVPWLGQVPAHWAVQKVKHVARVVNGYPFDSKLFGFEGHEMIRIRDIASIETETKYAGEWVEAAEVSKGDVLVGMDGDFNVSSWRGSRALLNQRVCSIRAKDPIIVNFLRWAIVRPLKLLNEITYSTTVKHLSSSELLNLSVAVPPAPEMKTICDSVNLADSTIATAISSQERMIELLKERRSAIITQAVTGQIDVR